MRTRGSILCLGAALLGCGAHLHRPQDDAAAATAQKELVAAKLVEGFDAEVEQAKALLAIDLSGADAWTRAGRDRDLLDVLGATLELSESVQADMAGPCRGRFRRAGAAMLQLDEAGQCLRERLDQIDPDEHPSQWRALNNQIRALDEQFAELRAQQQ